VARCDQLRHKRPADGAGSARQEDFHGISTPLIIVVALCITQQLYRFAETAP
jgi:hypothetical protein